MSREDLDRYAAACHAMGGDMDTGPMATDFRLTQEAFDAARLTAAVADASAACEEIVRLHARIADVERMVGGWYEEADERGGTAAIILRSCADEMRALLAAAPADKEGSV